MAGVYQIYNTVTSKRYIGSSIDIERRLKLHKSNLRNNRHCNSHLLNAWNKYQEYLVLEPVEYCEPDLCLKLELLYMDYYNSANRLFGYNIDKYAASAGSHLSEETKQKLSAKHKGKKLSKETVLKMVLANTGKRKPKQSDTMKEKYANGYTISRYGDMPIEKLIEWSKHLSDSSNKRYANFDNRPEGFYLKVLFSSDIKYYPSMREAAKALGVNKGAILYVLNKTLGFMKKLNCTFVRISNNEYKQANK